MEVKRQDLWLPRGSTQADFLASAARLRAAGLIESIDHDPTTGRGEVSFTPACLRLMQAGRNPFAEEGFILAWLTGEPAAVRSWLESEAAALGDFTR
jgi:hypothetical protein